jgi:hypothetical protein
VAVQYSIDCRWMSGLGCAWACCLLTLCRRRTNVVPGNGMRAKVPYASPDLSRSLCLAPTTTAPAQFPNAFLVFHGIDEGLRAHLDIDAGNCSALSFALASTQPTDSQLAAAQYHSSNVSLRRALLHAAEVAVQLPLLASRRPIDDARRATARQVLWALVDTRRPASKCGPLVRKHQAHLCSEHQLQLQQRLPKLAAKAWPA